MKKKFILAVLILIICYGVGLVTYYSGHSQAGENIVLFSLLGFLVWDFGFIAEAI